ncbi:hypothetical protein ACH4SK_13365 [Streptomyces inhibens]|uniref:hypothetical protein n=1 Tax=Streptomyces inhibens TaxID=2293571 RepID=UPI0037A4DDD9
MIDRVTGWMRKAPWWVVAMVLVYAGVLVFVGAAAHLTDLVRSGLHPYRWAPEWLNLFWSSLAVFDSLAALLLVGGRRAGVDLMCAIMATDVAANWYAAYGIQHSDFFAEPGLQRLTAFALLVCATGPFVRSRLGPAAG